MLVSRLETSVAQHILGPEFCMTSFFAHQAKNTECMPDIWVSVVMFTVAKMHTVRKLRKCEPYPVA